jgi:hypothetical protein
MAELPLRLSRQMNTQDRTIAALEAEVVQLKKTSGRVGRTGYASRSVGDRHRACRIGGHSTARCVDSSDKVDVSAMRFVDYL